MAAFQKRLGAIKRRAGLTDKELGLWFGTPKSTLSSWLRRGRQPQWYRRDDVERRLKLLEDAIRRKRLPPPLSIRQGERLDYVRSHAPG